MRHGAILLPGIITPAEFAYGGLKVALGDDTRVLLCELTVYAGEAPPANYDLETEIANVLATADRAGFDRFHLAGYSAGGAISAALAARYPERLISLALFEPAWLGNEHMGEEERDARAEMMKIMRLPPAQALPGFIRLSLAPGVALPSPPPGDPPPWMTKRPAGIVAITEAFNRHRLDTEALRHFAKPVLFILGRLSSRALYGRSAEFAKTLFADFRLEIFDERHHFDPPHRAEPERLAAMLMTHWARAEALAS